MQSLVAEVGSHRQIAARLAGGFAWGPLKAAPSGSDAADRRAGEQLAIAQIAKRVDNDRTPFALADHATALLLSRRSSDAIDALDEALEGAPLTAGYWSDLAAAHLSRFDDVGRATDLPRALDAVERSLDLARLPEALFNRSLLFERLNLQEAAQAAWADYLAVDPHSPWAGEARAHLDVLKKRSVESANVGSTQRVREQIVDDMLLRWATAEDDAVASRALERVRAANRGLMTSSSDRLISDIIDAIDKVAGRPDARTALRRAHARYGAARETYKEDGFAEADRQFAEAESDAASSGSPLLLLIRMYRGILRYRLNDSAGAQTSLTALLEALPSSYPSLSGRAHWILGLLATLRGSHRDAIDHYGAAARSLALADEKPNLAFVQMLEAAQLDAIGDIDGAWRLRVSAFAAIDRESPIQNAAQSAARAGWWRAASALHDVVATMARAGKRDTILADAIRSRARTLAVAGDREQGLSILKEAKLVAQKHPEAAWNPIRAEIDLAEAECALTQSPATAVEAATRALDYFAANRRESRLPEPLLARARAYRASGRTAEAIADLNAGIDVLERIRGTVNEWVLRATLGDIASRLGDELVTLHVQQGRTDEAFEAAERLRAWERRASSSGTSHTSTTLRALADQMPDHALLMWFFVGADDTFIWAVRKGENRFVKRHITHERLTRLIDRQPATSSEAAHELRHALLGPLERDITRATRLVIVADGPLHRLPFAALPGASARFLIEEQAVLLSPSAGAFIASLNRGARSVGEDAAALVVGNPAFDRATFPSLRSLPESDSEASEVSKLYSGTTLLTGPDATRQAILSALPKVAFFHFAGHSILNPFVPGESHLVVAGPTAQTISAAEISALPLDGIRLVLLSSCESLAGPSTRSEGPLGLARAFLSAGAANVVASRIPVADRLARSLATAFHREFRQTGDAALALQRAQRALLASQDPALSSADQWSAFVVVGAN